MKRKSILVLLVLLSSAALAQADPTARFQFERAIDTAPSPYGMAVDDNGGVYFVTIGAADSGLYYIADPINDATNIERIDSYVFDIQRGMTGCAVDSNGNVYAIGDNGQDASSVFKKYGPAPDFTPDSTFAPTPSRQQGIALLGDGVIVATKFNDLIFYDTSTGAQLRSYRTNATYQRDIAVNPMNSDIYVSRSGNYGTGSVLQVSGGDALNVAGYVVSVSPFISDVQDADRFASYGQGLGFYEDRNWLLVNNNVDGPTHALQIYEIDGDGVSATKRLLYEIDGLDSGDAIGSPSIHAVDAAVHDYSDGERLILTDVAGARILVYQFLPPPSSVEKRWEIYE